MEDFELQYQNDLTQALQAEANAEVALANAEDALSDFSFTLGRIVTFDDEAIESMRRLTVAVEQAQATLNTAAGDVLKLQMGSDPLLRQQLEAAAELDRANLEKIQSGLDTPGNGTATPVTPQVEAAQTRLALAEEALANLSPDSDPSEVALREEEVSAALASLATEEQSSAAIQAGVYPYEVELQVANLFLAQANLEDAIERLLALQLGPDPVGLALKEAQLVLSEANLAKSREDLAGMIAGPVPEEIESARIELALVQVKLPESEEALQILMEGAEELDVALARQRIEVALDDLAIAEGNFTSLTIVAPFDGIVSSVNFTPGQNIEVGTGSRLDPVDRLIQLVDSSVLEMVPLVDESDVGHVEIGQEATISVNALPGNLVHGTVASISTIAIGGGQALDDGRAHYEVNISASVEQVTNLNLLEGMTASADILIDQRANVLYIPVAALGGDDQPTVELVADGTVTFANVTPGLKNNRRVEIKRGLKEGDTVRVNRSKSNSLPTY